MYKYKDEYPIAKMARWLEVSRAGYYKWLKHDKNVQSQSDKELADRIIAIWQKSNRVYGIKKITHELNKDLPEGHPDRVNHKRVERVMRMIGISSKTTKKHRKIKTTDSDHNYKTFDNILNRNFSAQQRNQKWVSDITYVYTEEGWLYVAAIMDLYGRKILGLSMGTSMTTQLILDALNDAKNRAIGNIAGVILHSDQGSQYCSHEYQKALDESQIICSMSRVGQCWDNAPMESFWSKLKSEWLEDYNFETIEEAKAKVFEYVWIFYNNQRIHESNGNTTPEWYHSQENVA